MSENEENVNEEQTPEEAAEEAAPEAAAPEEPAAEEAPAEEPAADEPAAEEPAAEEAAAEEATADEAAAEEPTEEPAPDEPAAEEPPAEEPPAEEPAAEEPAAAAPASDEEPEAPLSPKERRRQARSTHTGEARPPRTIEERALARAETRSRKATHRRAYRQKQREKRSGQPRAESPDIAPETTPSGRLKTRQGIVVSDKADKTITVRIDSARPHRKYKKIVRSGSTLHAHDEQNEAHIGDTVRLVESRPLSRTKRWRLVEVLERAR
jgi:small subunit ribosomal protein S17